MINTNLTMTLSITLILIAIVLLIIGITSWFKSKSELSDLIFKSNIIYSTPIVVIAILIFNGVLNIGLTNNKIEEVYQAEIIDVSQYEEKHNRYYVDDVELDSPFMIKRNNEEKRGTYEKVKYTLKDKSSNNLYESEYEREYLYK